MPVRAHALDELAAVDGAAAGLGRDRARQGDVAAAQLVGADGERGDGAVHGALGELAGLGQALAQADDARKGVDDGEALVGRAAISSRQLLVPRSTAP